MGQGTLEKFQVPWFNYSGSNITQPKSCLLGVATHRLLRSFRLVHMFVEVFVILVIYKRFPITIIKI